VNPRELESHPFIGYEEESEIRMMMDSFFRRMSLSIEYALESSNVATIKHMVMAGWPSPPSWRWEKSGRASREDRRPGPLLARNDALLQENRTSLYAAEANFIQREIKERSETRPGGKRLTSRQRDLRRAAARENGET
jgi:hypothetical protein